MIHLKNFLNDRNMNKMGSLHFCIGVDPSITSTGWAIVVQPVDTFKNHVVAFDVINPPGRDISGRLSFLYESLRNELSQFKLELLRHNIRGRKTNADAYTLGCALEVPAFFGRGMQTLSRDLKHRDAVTACRLCLNQAEIEIIGEEMDDGDEHPIRPNMLQAFVGSSGLKGDAIKEQTKKWVQEKVIFVKPEENMNHDLYDAIALACMAFEYF